ncbi:heme-binding domain-containing protein [Planctomycetes bacterium Poly30]
MKTLRRALLVLFVLFLAIQLVPVDRANPPVTGDVDAPAEVKAILERSCYDCHSNAVKWPWYSYVAPVSFLVAHDVEEAREHLNFSEWDKRNESKRAKIREECFEECEQGEMPLPIYLIMHQEAKLSEADLAVLKAWAGVAGGSGAAGEDNETDD